MSRDACPRVLVLLATFNGRDWIAAQIASLLAQRGVALEIWVSDDVSTDGTRALVEGLARDEPRIRLLETRAPSGSAGANFRQLFRAAPIDGFDYVALADQDDLWHDDKLLHATRSLQASGAHGYSSSVTAFWPDGREQVLRQDPRTRAADFLFEGAGQGCSFVLTNRLFQEVRTFCVRHPAQADALHYHDWLIYLLARLAGRPWMFDPQSRIRYRQHANNEIGARGGAGAIRNRLARIRDGWYRAQVAAALDVHAALGVHCAVADRFDAFFGSHAMPSAGRRLALAALLARHSRRRLVDRLVLVVAALAGWLDPVDARTAH